MGVKGAKEVLFCVALGVWRKKDGRTDRREETTGSRTIWDRDFDGRELQLVFVADEYIDMPPEDPWTMDMSCTYRVRRKWTPVLLKIL